MAIFKLENNRLYWQHGAEKILIQPWGDNGLRVRVTRAAKLDESEDWALLPAGDHKAEMAMVKTAPKNKKQMAAAGGPGEDAPLVAEENAAYIKNGKVAAFIDRHGYLFFYNDKGQELTRECIRNRNDLSEYSVPLGMQARFLHPNVGADDWRAALSFEAYEDEKIFGMGQYQEDKLNLKGLKLELV